MPDSKEFRGARYFLGLFRNNSDAGVLQKKNQLVEIVKFTVILACVSTASTPW